MIIQESKESMKPSLLEPAHALPQVLGAPCGPQVLRVGPWRPPYVHVQVHKSDPSTDSPWRPPPPRPGESPGPRVGGPHGAPGLGELPGGARQVLGGSAPRSPRDTPSQAGLGACPGGPDGPPEGSGPGRLRPVPGTPQKVRCVGFFKGTLKVRPGRNRLAFQILRQMTH